MTKRRALLHGGKYEIRPPWALESEPFFKACTGCDECLNICPTSIIVKDRFNYPLLDFSRGECLFCQECVGICPTGALTTGPIPWNHTAQIKDTCLAKRGTLCRLCGEACEHNAISFKPQVGGTAPPVMNQLCNGCGACINACPVQALFIA